MTGGGRTKKEGTEMTYRNGRFGGLKGGVAMAAFAAFLQGAPVAAQVQTHELNIAAQDLGGALRAVARATRQEITFDNGSVRGRRAPALRGSYTARQAVEALLVDSNLRLEVGRSGLFIIRGGSPSEAT